MARLWWSRPACSLAVSDFPSTRSAYRTNRGLARPDCSLDRSRHRWAVAGSAVSPPGWSGGRPGTASGPLRAQAGAPRNDPILVRSDAKVERLGSSLKRGETPALTASRGRRGENVKHIFVFMLFSFHVQRHTHDATCRISS